MRNDITLMLKNWGLKLRKTLTNALKVLLKHLKAATIVLKIVLLWLLDYFLGSLLKILNRWILIEWWRGIGLNLKGGSTNTHITVQSTQSTNKINYRTCLPKKHACLFDCKCCYFDQMRLVRDHLNPKHSLHSYLVLSEQFP